MERGVGDKKANIDIIFKLTDIKYTRNILIFFERIILLGNQELQLN